MQWFRDRRVRGRPPHPDVLTPAEWRVLEHVREGLPNAEIAVRLGLSVPTVKTHVSSMLAKLELRDRSELAAWDGEPAEASRGALGRFALGAPLGWLREGLAASYLGKAALVAGVAAISVGGYVAVAGLSGAGGGAPPPRTTGTSAEVLEATPDLSAEETIGWLRSLDGVAAVLDAVEAADSGALVAIAYRHRAFCSDARIADQRAAEHVCVDDIVEYEGLSTEVWPPDVLDARVRTIVPPWLVTEEAMAASLDEAFGLGRWVLANVYHEPYRRATPEGYMDAERLILAWRLDSPRGLDTRGAIDALALSIEVGEAEPITSIDFLLAEEWPPQFTVTRPEATPPRDRVGSDTVAALRRVDALAGLLDTIEHRDLAALIETIQRTEASCISPPLPGKHIPEVCERFGLDTFESYSGYQIAFGVFFGAHEQRVRYLLAPLLRGSQLRLVGAWRIESHEGERYVLAHQGDVISGSGRNDALNLGIPSWSMLLLHVDPDADRPIEWIELLPAQYLDQAVTLSARSPYHHLHAVVP